MDELKKKNQSKDTSSQLPNVPQDSDILPSPYLEQNGELPTLSTPWE